MSEENTSGWKNETASEFSDGGNQAAGIQNSSTDNSATSGGTLSPAPEAPAAVNAETIIGETRSRAPEEETTVEDVCNKFANPICSKLDAIDTTIKSLYKEIEQKYVEEKSELKEKLARLEKVCRFKEEDELKRRLEIERLNAEIGRLNEEIKSLNLYKNALEDSTRASHEEERKAKEAFEKRKEEFAAETARLIEEQKRERDALTQQCEAVASQNRSDMEALKKTHADEMMKMANTHAEDIKAKDAYWQAKLDAKEEELRKSRADVEKEYSDRLEAVRAKIEKAMPKEVCDLFGYKVDAEDAEDTRRRLQCVYSFMCLLSGSLGKDIFLRRFRAFDAALLEIMGSDVNALDDCRAHVEEWLNKKLASGDGDCAIAIHWPSEGDEYNGDHHSCTNDNASLIRRAKSACVFCKEKDGSEKCLSRAEVDAE